MRIWLGIYLGAALVLFFVGAGTGARAKVPHDPKKALAKWQAIRDPRRIADPAHGPIQRRIKIITDGHTTLKDSPFIVDSADPSLVQPISYPGHPTRYRISFTGMFYIEASDPADFFRGGIFPIQRARGFYPDGTEMEILYDGAASPWDVIWVQNHQGSQLAFGGLMEQSSPGELPGLDRNNTRSRWWGEVKRVKLRSGKYEERIKWRKPLHDFNRRPRRNHWIGHGYGGTLLTSFDPAKGIHVPERLGNGNFLLFYERISHEEDGSGGPPRPWITNIFARELIPSLKNAAGPEYLSTDLISPLTGNYFSATARGLKGDEGYLVEGPAVFREREHGQLIKTFSAGDFTGRYGIFLDYLSPGADPRGKFHPVTGEDGELIDFASVLNLREILNATWVGRPLLEYAPDGKLWLRFHFVPIDVLPPEAPVEGLPPYELWGSYPRFIAQVPVRIQFDKSGQPGLALDLDPAFTP
jgi:hypothetical protein